MTALENGNDENSRWKRFQRQLLTSVSKRFNCCLFSFITVVTVSCVCLTSLLAIRYASSLTEMNDTNYCSQLYKNNLGHRSFYDKLCYPQIDAVYTWVNGSDPNWLREMLYYKNMENMTYLNESTSTKRFRDKDELKYSLRSVERFAPWIHKIFIVTNGQIPDWLDTNHPKVEIITHRQIFQNQSVLPTYSSAAIELNLHRIPGLSEYFLYLNDDVFFGSPVYPYDFMTLEKGAIMYYSWDVPDCNSGCAYENLGNGFCDSACNVQECGYDLGDCKGVQSIEKQAMSERPEVIRKSKSNSGVNNRCAEGCPFLWIGDGSCDSKCNVEACAYDAYDCNDDKQQYLNTTYARFVCLSPSSSIYDYVTHTYPSSFLSDSVSEPICVSRVVVNRQQSYISVDLDGVKSYGYRVKSIELIDDEVVYSSVYHSFYNELILVLNKAVVQEEVSTQIRAIIHGVIENGQDRFFFLEIMRIDFSSLQPHSQLASFQYSVKDHNRTDAMVLSTNDDALVCRIKALNSELKPIVFRRSHHDEMVYVIDEHAAMGADSLLQTMNHIYSSRNPLDVVYEGNFTHLKLISSPFPSSFTTLPIGSEEEVRRALREYSYPKQYRKVCYELFTEEARRKGFVDTNETLAINVPYLTAAALFQDRNGLPLRIMGRKENAHFFSTYEELMKGVESTIRIYYGKPVRRKVQCHVDMSIWSTNSYYMERMKNCSTLISSNQEVYRVSPIGIRELRYRIEYTEEEIPTSIDVFVPHGFIDEALKNSCISKDKNQTSIYLSSSYLLSNKETLDYSSSFVKESLRYRFNVSSLSELQQLLYGSSRRLGDIYEDTVVSSNLLLLKLFGKETRRVPAHMPHLIDKQILNRIEERIKPYVESTISHRFLAFDDLNYAFIYYYFLKEFEKEKEEVYYRSLWSLYLDTDGDGVLSENEMKTLGSILYGDTEVEMRLSEIKNCLTPETVDSVKVQYSFHNVYETTIRKRPYATYDQYRKCAFALNSVNNKFSYSTRLQFTKDNGIGYTVVEDNLNRTIEKLNKIRKQRPRFICIDDGIEKLSPELQRVIHDFYESFFPLSSQFEKRISTLRKEAPTPSSTLVYFIFGLICLFGIAWSLFLP